MKKHFVDVYEVFGLNKTEKTLELRMKAGQCLRILKKRQSNANVEELKNLQAKIDICEFALKVFQDDDKRKKYDFDLAEAINRNEVFYKNNQKINTLIDNARDLFNKDSFEMAIHIIKGSINEVSNNREAWLILTDSMYMNGDYDELLDYINNAVIAFPKDIDLRFRQIRFLTLFEKYNDAQDLINKAIIDFEDSPIFYAEQIYLYMSANKNELAKQYLDKYIDEHPSDANFREITSGNLISLALNNYVIEPHSGEQFPITQEKYDRCLELITWANQIWQDEFSLDALEHIKSLAVKKFDSQQSTRIFMLLAIAVVLVIIDLSGVLFAIPALAIAFNIWRKSQRPLWMQYRDILRGYSDAQLAGDFL